MITATERKHRFVMNFGEKTMLPSLLIIPHKKAARAAMHQIGASHYDWKLLGFVLGFCNWLGSGVVALFWRRFEAINIIQINAATTAPASKYAVIKVPSIVIHNPFCVSRSLISVNVRQAKHAANHVNIIPATVQNRHNNAARLQTV